ncbi:hypothetical protein [Nonomuraea angiospora]|uniref:hypothetical protein n=1 Tax=Nonomuraea angiospora TaxID=46172 RepID=UPI001CEF3A18|nr:hypothetical protein [Nonomuraea angiospora]
MSAGRYRSIFHTRLTPADAIATASREWRQWLVKKSAHKKINIEAYDDGQAVLGDGIVLLRDTRTAGDGTQTSKWQLREHKDGGYWLSSLIVHAPGKVATADERTWFWLDVEHVRPDLSPEDTQRPSPAALPGLARQLLGTLDARDHWAYLRPTPTLVRPDRLDDLLEVLTDEQRRLPAIVASPHDRISFSAWKSSIDGVTRFLPGLASLYLLDPLTAEEFNHAVGTAYEVRGGAVRTYLPDLDLAVEEDAVRHRFLTGARIEADAKRSAQLITALPRQLAADGRLPGPLNKLTRTTAVSPPASPRPVSPPSATSSSDFARLIEENVKLLAENVELNDLLDLAGYEEQKVREDAANLQDGLLDTAAELEVANQKIAELTDLVRTLRRRLTSAGRAAEAYLPAEVPTVLPTQLPEVLERLEELDRVEFTGEIDYVWKLQEKAQSSTWAQTAWQVLLALQDYAEAVSKGEFNGDFRRWCTEPVPGAAAISAGKVKPDESDTVHTNARLSRLRLLPVPPEVDPSGHAYMWSHIRIGSGAGMSAPRMHYFDDVRNTGKIYIGYLGPHLPVKSTN